jgi:hypothetical protein
MLQDAIFSLARSRRLYIILPVLAGVVETESVADRFGERTDSLLCGVLVAGQTSK